MCDLLVLSLDKIRWPEAISAFAALATAIIAFKALQTWKQQDNAKNKVEFLDALIEVAHDYIAQMTQPITVLEVAKIGMKSYSQVDAKGEQENIDTQAAIAYIQKRGEQDSKRLLDVLEVIQPTMIKLRSLAAKGQVFNFDEYGKSQFSVEELASHFDAIEAFTAVIGSSTWNWNNPSILELLNKVKDIDAEAIRKSIKECNVALLEFANKAYKQIYG